MRLWFLLLLLAAVLLGSGAWYQVFNPVCKVPVEYSIGNIDGRFGTNKEELVRVAKNAELIWENDLGQNLFEYTETGGLPINLVFDERQRNADLEEQLRQDLDAKEGMSTDVAQQYERLIAEFRELKKSYEAKVVLYESRLKKYNTTVTRWNEQGGAPEDEIDKLKTEADALKLEQQDLEQQAEKLNTVVDQLNLIGAKGNDLITDYNLIVEEYNTRFSEREEYTQGDHSVEEINVYQFNSEEELTLVLAHEFGHALWLGHVENEQSIMHRLMGGQDIDFGLSDEDMQEFGRVCTEKGLFQSIFSMFQNAL